VETIYPSKLDTWLLVSILGVPLICVTGLYPVVTLDAPRALAAALPTLLLGVGLPLWLLLSTTYTLGPTLLRISCGPFTWKVPIGEIRAITPTRNPLSSPALSLDRLRIDYGRGDSVMISPKYKEQFLRDIEALRARSG
jgi:hypothetical protein